MTRFALLLIASVFVAGCGGTPEEQSVDLMNEMADVLETVKDKKTAEAAFDELEELNERGKELFEQLKDKKPEDMPEDVKAEMEKAVMRVAKEMMRIMGDAEALAVLAPLKLGK